MPLGGLPDGRGDAQESTLLRMLRCTLHFRSGSFSTELSRQQVGPCPLFPDSDQILQASEMS
jgi:hypothetical protein